MRFLKNKQKIVLVKYEFLLGFAKTPEISNVALKKYQMEAPDIPKKTLVYTLRLHLNNADRKIKLQ